MAFTGTGHPLGGESPLMLRDSAGNTPTLAGRTRVIPSLKDICVGTLDRYIDLLDDIGTTPFYLIESVLRKCNVKQLTRIELYTEGLSEQTDELWYRHAVNDFDVFREKSPHYDESGEWRSKYHTMKQEVEDRFERRRAQLRQSYSQHDKFRQDRRVILDPNLRLPKKAIRNISSSSSWSSPAPKKKTLFEKARMEARKITQMYNSNPYPPPRSRISSSSSSSSSSRARTTSIQPRIVESGPSGTLFRPEAPPAQTRRYSYKTRPVVYTPLARPIPHQSAEESVSPSQKKAPSAHKLITPSAPGAIVDFFKEINPDHSQHASVSHHTQVDSGSRSPPSPLQPSSRTIQMLREDVARYGRYHGQLSKKQFASGPLMENVAVDGDFSWLENDDDDDNDSGHDRGGGGSNSGSFAKKGPIKAPVSLEEAGRQFLNRLIGK